MDWNNLTSGLAGAVLGSILGPLVQGYTYGYFKEQQEKWESKKFKHVLSSELKELKKTADNPNTGSNWFAFSIKHLENSLDYKSYLEQDLMEDLTNLLSRTKRYNAIHSINQQDRAASKVQANNIAQLQSENEEIKKILEDILDKHPDFEIF